MKTKVATIAPIREKKIIITRRAPTSTRAGEAYVHVGGVYLVGQSSRSSVRYLRNMKAIVRLVTQGLVGTKAEAKAALSELA